MDVHIEPVWFTLSAWSSVQFIHEPRWNLENIKENSVSTIVNISVNNDYRHGYILAVNFYYSVEKEYQLKNRLCTLTRFRTKYPKFYSNFKI